MVIFFIMNTELYKYFNNMKFNTQYYTLAHRFINKRRCNVLHSVPDSMCASVVHLFHVYRLCLTVCG